MENLELKQSIRKVLEPHINRLNYFYELAIDNNLTVKTIEEINNVLKDNRQILKNSNFKIENYKNYYELIYEISRSISNSETINSYKKKLTNPSRSLLIELDQEYIDRLFELKKSEFKFKQFLRRSSTIKNIENLMKSIDKSFDFECSEQIQTILEHKDSITKEGYTFLKLTKDLLKICPTAWCIHNDYEKFIEYSSGDNNDIWLTYNHDKGSVGGLNIDTNGSDYNDYWMTFNNDRIDEMEDVVNINYRKHLEYVDKDDIRKKQYESNIKDEYYSNTGRMNREIMEKILEMGLDADNPRIRHKIREYIDRDNRYRYDIETNDDFNF